MGFQSTATTTTLIAKLTPLGRQLLVTNTNNLITKFALGDSDANYNVVDSLGTGQVPSLGGNIGPNGGASNSTGNDSAIKYPVYLNDLGGNLKSVDPASINVTNVLLNNGQTTGISGTNVTDFVVDINDVNTDPNVNLFTSFGLPVTQAQKTAISATTYANGGWGDTALSGLAADKIAVISIENSQFGENLDGKEIKLDITTTASSYTIYSTFQDKGRTKASEDANYKDTANTTVSLGRSLAFLVSDDIMQPNGGDTTKSWATGFGTTKPFSVNHKEFYNLRTDSNVGKSADTVVGVAYLDKGILVITEPSIVNDIDPAIGLTPSLTINSVSTNVIQNITCVAGRGEFGTSSNPTWTIGDPVRITELGLYDNLNRLIAYGKFDRSVNKTKDGFMSFGIKITV